MKPAREDPGGGWPFALLQTLALYLAFEDFFLRWLPVSETVYSLARFGSEAVLYGLFGFVALARATRGLPLARSPIDPPPGDWTVPDTTSELPPPPPPLLHPRKNPARPTGTSTPRRCNIVFSSRRR